MIMGIKFTLLSAMLGNLERPHRLFLQGVCRYMEPIKQMRISVVANFPKCAIQNVPARGVMEYSEDCGGGECGDQELMFCAQGAQSHLLTENCSDMEKQWQYVI